jgi:hypothetical protein
MMKAFLEVGELAAMGKIFPGSMAEGYVRTFQY